jgi:Asp-tRNA(Asn)/Glu-tRNA(Gln) amidotransferase A subunit family amidase
MGLSSREGIIPLSHSQDVAGPIARSVTDLALLLDATVGEDPADPVTAASRDHVPTTYLGFMGDSSLVNVEIGVVTSLMGDAREDEEVRHVVSEAIDVLGSMGAGTSDVDVPGLTDLLRDTSTIDHEFKFDLMDFLEAHRAPVRSLDEILRWGLYRTELDATFRRRNATERRDSEAYRTTLARRGAATAAVAAAMRTRGLTLLAYPTIRRKAAKIGDVQEGSNCQLSATTGLPALSMPAGFTDDGLPVGLELLGPAFSEGTLLRVAYAYERLMRPRRAPALGR